MVTAATTILLTTFALLIQSTWLSNAFTIPSQATSFLTSQSLTKNKSISTQNNLSTQSESESSSWNGEVVSNTGDGRIRGCSITKVDGKLSEWIISIDGIEADLGKFSDAIYRKITSDAKNQRFQGFRPGTIPPHLLPTYVAFAMDECAREATLEAMSQNDIKPFDDARMEIQFDTISILPPKKKGKKNNKSKKKNQVQSQDEDSDSVGTEQENRWVAFETMKEAIDAGWKVRDLKYFVSIYCRCTFGRVFKLLTVVSCVIILSLLSLGNHLALLHEMSKVKR